MAERKEVGLFARPIETLAETKTVRDILADPKDDIQNHFTKVNCIMKKTQVTLKDGTKLEPRYSLTLSLHPTVHEAINNKKMVNETEFTLLCFEFLKPIDTTEIKFEGWVRFLRGTSEAIDRDDKTFTVVELFINPNLSPINAFLSNANKLLIERLQKLSSEQLAIMKTVPFNEVKLFRLSKKQSDIVSADLSSGE